MTTTATTTLTDFLLARIEDDEATARAATPAPWVDAGAWFQQAHDGEAEVSIAHPAVGGGPLGNYMVAETWREDRNDAAHIARHDPARVLAECEAKRRIVEALVDMEPVESERHDQVVTLRWVCKALAAVYVSHADYDDSWRP